MYVACKNGNLNIVKLLILKGANAYILSSIGEEGEENNLQVAVRWKHYEVVNYLLEKVDWTKEDFKDSIKTEGI